MVDHKSQPDSNETPEDVATLYSWANLHGAKYRDFSNSRAVAREEARLRVEAAKEAERVRLEEEAERKRQEEVQLAARLAAEAAEAERRAEEERLAEIARQAEAERQAVLAAQEAQRQAALQRSWQPPPPEAFLTGYDPAFSTEPEHYPVPTPQFIHNAGSVPNTEMAMEAGLLSVESNPQPQPGLFVPAPQSSRAMQASGPLPGLNSALPGDAIVAMQPRPYADVQPFTPQSSRQPIERPGIRPASAHQEAYLGTASEFAYGDYGSSSQEEAVAFRPAWLAPPPNPVVTQAPVVQSQPTRGSQPSYIPPHYTQAAQSPPAASPTSARGPMQQHGSFAGLSASAFSRSPEPAQHQPPAPTYASEPQLPAAMDTSGNRWYALKSLFDPQVTPAEPVSQAPAPRAPILAVFSLAGGVGKTSLLASLGRALAAHGERILLIDTAVYGLLPFFFGARDQRPGLLRTFNPPGTSLEPPIQLVTLDPDGHTPEGQTNTPQDQQSAQAQDWLAQEVGRYSRGVSRVLVDLPTASGATTRRVMRLAPTILVPILPDMNSVVSVGAIEAFFRNSSTGNVRPIMPYYVLNQFDYSLPLHLDVRELLREQIGDRLLPFALRRSTAVSEALAEGMTVMDYAPSAVVAEDYASLAEWVRSIAAPATQVSRGVRWSER